MKLRYLSILLCELFREGFLPEKSCLLRFFRTDLLFRIEYKNHRYTIPDEWCIRHVLIILFWIWFYLLPGQ